MKPGENALARILQDPKALIGATVILTTATVAIYYGYTSSAAKAKRDADIPVLTDKSLETFHPTKMAEPATKDSTTIVRKLSVKIPPPSTSPEEPAKDAEADAA